MYYTILNSTWPCRWLYALQSVFGKMCDLEKLPEFLKTADYNNQMVAPSGEDYNYSDYHIEQQNEPAMLWFGKQLNRADIIRDELSDLNRYYEVLKTGKNAKAGKNVVIYISMAHRG